ncbi:NAD-dependent epimerase/dehydratase family protein [Christiangramia forsetii]|uniref:CapI-like UDP-glucuronic acid epimerase n=2 Tax=Christiangramia forsetii TaxID=411153 RepID=A0LXP1_CHRFK|nr:NAD-dependent epimerase/dehydratase family protein [Christiangramia forsetii]GGG36308.1 NAD-dependent epimerase [Christiangramia forsetii]CAL65136.1 CapI-like UDP-glucuronic acid epimerase [Christiangramia forsetii KT0803]
MKILVTGAAGFIGFHLCEKLVKENHEVIGLDNINDYYSQDLKLARLKELGIKSKESNKFNSKCLSTIYPNFSFFRMNLEDRDSLPELFKKENFDIVCNLAAQAGVRYSLENPEAYIDSNLVGFANIIECCRNHHIKHLIYASSSSVYGQNKKIPFSTDDRVDEPISLYAATKRSNEIMAYTYSHLYKLPTTGLRFFTVYGPWGRPDMAMFLFADAITNGKVLKVFNEGNLERDFTFVDDIVNGVMAVVNRVPSEKDSKYNLFNIGNSKPINLLNFIKEIEDQLGLSAEKQLMPMQPGDVDKTWADSKPLMENFDYQPSIEIKEGVQKYLQWFKMYYNS